MAQLAARVNGRLEKAVVLASTPAAVVSTHCDFDWLVHSESNPLGSYLVDGVSHTCTCPDHGAHGQAGIVCKHRLAAYIYQTAFKRWFVPPTPRQPQPGDIGEVSYMSLVGRLPIECRLLGIYQFGLGPVCYHVEALQGHPFDDNCYQTSWAYVDPQSWTPLPVEAQEAQ